MTPNPAALNARMTRAKAIWLDLPKQWRPSYRELAARADASYQTIYELMNGLKGTSPKRKRRTREIQQTIAQCLGAMFDEVWD